MESSRGDTMSAARRAAADVLSAWIVADPAHARLGSPKRPFPPPELAPRDRAFARELAEGSVRRLRTLDRVLHVMTEGRKARPAGLRAALLVAAWELIFGDSSQAHAVVHNAVNLARRAAGEGGARFANAILRRLSAMPALEDWIVPPASDADADALADWFSLPSLVVERWTEAFGPESARALFEQSAARATRCLRVHRNASLEAVADGLRDAGFELVPGPAPRSLLVTGERASILETDAFARGQISLQDATQIEVAALVLECCEPGRGARILDFCAAPGSKTCAIAEGLEAGSTIVAYDVRPERLARLSDEARRLGVEERIVVAADRGELDAQLAKAGSFDAVLVDAPCSNSGVFARRAEARRRFTAEALDAHAQTQLAILDEASRFLRPGGCLIYSTCSIEARENEDVARSFAARSGARVLSSERILPELGVRDGGGVTLLRSSETPPEPSAPKPSEE